MYVPLHFLLYRALLDEGGMKRERFYVYTYHVLVLFTFPFLYVTLKGRGGFVFYCWGGVLIMRVMYESRKYIIKWGKVWGASSFGSFSVNWGLGIFLKFLKFFLFFPAGSDVIAPEEFRFAFHGDYNLNRFLINPV